MSKILSLITIFSLMLFAYCANLDKTASSKLNEKENRVKLEKLKKDVHESMKKLADKEIYTRLIQKQIQAWKAIRDSADHGGVPHILRTYSEKTN